MFTPPAKPAIAADGTLRLVSAPDPSREVRAAARACLQWAREGVPFWDMAVAYRHGEAYLPLAEAVFVEAGIPVYLHEGSPLAERPLGRQTLGLLALFDGDLSRQSVMDFLTDAKLPERAARGVRRDLDLALGLALARRGDRRRAPSSGSDGSRRCRPTADDDDDLPDWVAQRARGRRAARAVHRRARPPPARPAGAGDVGGAPRLPAGAARALRRRAPRRSIVALRGLERFTALEAEVDFDWFLDVVKRAIGTLRSEDVIDSRPGAFAARGREHRGGQLAGRDRVRARVDPRRDRAGVPAARAPGPDPARRRARDDLASGRRRRSRRASARGSEEALIFALACEAARERLVVSYARRATGESRPRLPSVFFRELASQLEGERVSAERRAAA